MAGIYWQPEPEVIHQFANPWPPGYTGPPKPATKDPLIDDDFSSGKLDTNIWATCDYVKQPSSTDNTTFQCVVSSENVSHDHGMLCLKNITKSYEGNLICYGATIRSINKYGYGTYLLNARIGSVAPKPSTLGKPSDFTVSDFLLTDDKMPYGADPNKKFILIKNNSEDPKKILFLSTTNIGERDSYIALGTTFTEYKIVVSKDEIKYYMSDCLIKTFKNELDNEMNYVYISHYGKPAPKYHEPSINVATYMWVRKFKFIPE